MGLDKILVVGHSPGKTPINKRKNGSPTLNRLNRWLDACEVDIYSFSNIYAHHKELLKMTDIDRTCLLYTSPSPRDRTRSRMPSSA